MYWSGAAFDSRRSQLIIAGASGGQDNSGNEVYAFNLDSLKWFKIKNGASTYDELDSLSPYYYNGGLSPDSQQPRPGYTFDQIEYDSTSDKVFILGLPFPATHSYGWKNILGLHVSDTTWSSPTEISHDFSSGSISARDPSSGRIWMFVNGGNDGDYLGHFNPSSGTWTDHGNMWTDNNIPTNQNAAIMPSTHRLISIGVGSAEYWDLSDPDEEEISQQELETTGCDSLLAKDAPGFEWFPIGRKMIGWAGGTHVYSMDSTYTCTDIAPNDSNTITPDAPIDVGTYGRWRYVQKYNVFVVVNSSDSSVWLYRPSSDAGSGGGSPPVVEITYPSEGEIIHESSTSVAWKVDGVTQTTLLTQSLSVGTNRIIRSATNSFGTTYDTVTVTRSTSPPVVTIEYPTQSLEVFSSPVPVSWKIDGVTQTTGTSQSLTEGINTITRQCVYNGGTQSVSASVTIYLDTQPETCLGP
jgi:hypothetical protein